MASTQPPPLPLRSNRLQAALRCACGSTPCRLPLIFRLPRGASRGSSVPLSRLRAGSSPSGRGAGCRPPEGRPVGFVYIALPRSGFVRWRLACHSLYSFLCGCQYAAHCRVRRGFFVVCPSPLLGGGLVVRLLLGWASCPLRGSVARSARSRAGGCPAPIRRPYSSPPRGSCVRAPPRFPRFARLGALRFPLPLVGFAATPLGSVVALAPLARGRFSASALFLPITLLVVARYARTPALARRPLRALLPVVGVLFLSAWLFRLFPS